MSEAQPDDPHDRETVIVPQEGEWLSARHEASGVASQGCTRSKALSNLADGLKLHAEDVDNVAPKSPTHGGSVGG